MKKEIKDTKALEAKLAEAQKAYEEEKKGVLSRHFVMEGDKKVPLKDAIKITVEDKSCWVRKPNRKDIAAAKALAEDEVAYYEQILENIFLEGDETIKYDDDYFLNVMPHLNGLIEAKRVELKKS